MSRFTIGVLLLSLASSGCTSAAPTVSQPPAATPSTTPTAGPTGTPTAEPGKTSTPEPTLLLPHPIDLNQTTATVIDARPSPDFIVLADGYAFASGVGKGVGRFDGISGALIDSITIPGESCEALDTGFGAAWTATCAGAGLARIDPESGSVTLIDVGGRIQEPEASVGAGEGAVWIIVGASSRELVRVDPATNTVTGRFPLPGSPTAVRAGLGAVWVSDPTIDSIHRIDPGTGALIATIRVGDRPQFIAVGEGALWTMDQLGGTVSRVDPDSNAVTATIELGEQVQGGDIAVGGGSVWLRGSRTLLFRIDPSSNEIIERYTPSAGSGSVAADDVAVWITAHDITTIWRLEYSGIVE